MATLKQLRESQKLSQINVGSELHVDRSTVSKWESGENRPPYEALIPLSRLYRVSIERLIEVITGVVA